MIDWEVDNITPAVDFMEWKHDIIISWDPTIGAIIVSGQLMRTVR